MRHPPDHMHGTRWNATSSPTQHCTQIMSDPVIIETGISYERQYISEWFASGKTTCPITNQGA